MGGRQTSAVTTRGGSDSDFPSAGHLAPPLDSRCYDDQTRATPPSHSESESESLIQNLQC